MDFCLRKCFFTRKEITIAFAKLVSCLFVAYFVVAILVGRLYLITPIYLLSHSSIMMRTGFENDSLFSETFPIFLYSIFHIVVSFFFFILLFCVCVCVWLMCAYKCVRVYVIILKCTYPSNVQDQSLISFSSFFPKI